MSTKTQAKPIFAATLTPHRSLTPRGKQIVIGLVALLALVPGLTFYLLGAWPVVGFMGLDILAIWFALSRSMQSGKAREHVAVWPGQLELKRFDAKGHETASSFDPHNVRFVIDRDFNEQVTGLWLRDNKERLAIGAFLSSEEKLSFSKAFGSALRKARG